MYFWKKKEFWQIITVIAMAIILLLLEFWIYPKATRVSEDITEQVSVDEAVMVYGYEQEGDAFVPSNEDPQIVLPCEVDKVREVTLQFQQPLEEDTALQIFYGQKSGFAADAVTDVTLEKGTKTRTVEVNAGCYDQIRFDIEGTHTLESVTVSGLQYSTNTFVRSMYLLAAAFIDLLALFFGVRYRGELLEFLIDKGRKTPGFLDGTTDWLGEKILAFGKKIHMNIYRFYLILALVLGIAYSFLLPIDQVPDESNHMRFLCEAVGAEGILDQYYTVVEEAHSIDSVKEKHAEMNMEDYVRASRIHFDKDAVTFTGDVSYKMICYIPCGLGFFLGYLLDLPILWCTFLGEFFSVLFGVGIGYLALRLMPIKKELLCAIMLMPMNLQQCASFNYDSIMLPLCYLFVAYVFYLKYRERKVKWKDLLILGIIIGVVALIKILYVLLAFLFFVIPLEHMELKIGKFDLTAWMNKHKVISSIGMVAIICAGCFVIRNVEYVLAVRACALEPLQGIHIFWNTFTDLRVFYEASLVGNFGWLDTSVSIGFVRFVLISLLILTMADNGEKGTLDRGSRINMAMVSMVLVFLINACMITWSFFLHDISAVTLADYREGLYAIDIIEGVQGRYYFPMLMCFYMFWEGILKINQKKIALWQVIHYVFVIIIPIQLLLDRFWIA